MKWEENSKLELKARIKAVEGIIELVYIDSLRSPPTDDIMYLTVKSWNEHFTRANIPTSELKDLYYEAVLEMSDNDFFSPKHIITMWKKRKERHTRNITCDICRGSGSIDTFNFKTGQDEPETCICQL